MMNCSEFESRLADLIGGELSNPERTAVLEHARTCVSCGQRLRRLTEAQQAIASTLMNIEDAQSRSATLAAPAVGGVRGRGTRSGYQWALAVARYAAVLVLAFAGGYGARGWQQRSPVPPPAAPEYPVPALVSAAPRVSVEWARRVELAAQRFADSPTLSLSLLGLARR